MAKKNKEPMVGAMGIPVTRQYTQQDHRDWVKRNGLEGQMGSPSSTPMDVMRAGMERTRILNGGVPQGHGSQTGGRALGPRAQAALPALQRLDQAAQAKRDEIARQRRLTGLSPDPPWVTGIKQAHDKYVHEQQRKKDAAAMGLNDPNRGRGGRGDPRAGGTGGVGGAAVGGTAPQSQGQGSYQSSINVGGGIGRGGVLAGLLDTGYQSNPNVSAFARATARNDASQIGRGIDAQNQQLFMDQQGKRAESTTQGLSNLAQIYGDYAERGIQQIGLAGQIMKNNIGFAAGMSRLQRQPAFGALSSMNPFGR